MYGSVNLVRFCKGIGLSLIAIKHQQQFELEYLHEAVRPLRLRCIAGAVLTDSSRSLFIDLLPHFEAYVMPALVAQQGMFATRVPSAVPDIPVGSVVKYGFTA